MRAIQAPLMLPDRLFVRSIDGLNLFLDVVNDRYFLLNRLQSTLFDEIVQASEFDTLSAEAQAFAEFCIERGYLTDDKRIAKPVESIANTKPISSFQDELAPNQFSLSSAAIIRFILSFVTTTRATRARTFVDRIKMAQTAKARVQSTIRSSRSQEDVFLFVRQFDSLTPFFFTTKDECLLKSFMLFDFLLRHGVAPEWVFGVQLAPFRAHCWLEHESVVLNDARERVACFDKILSV